MEKQARPRCPRKAITAPLSDATESNVITDIDGGRPFPIPMGSSDFHSKWLSVNVEKAERQV
jgi:hypothetical protein